MFFGISKRRMILKTAHLPKDSHSTYRPDIDGLRAIAVLTVIGHHVFPGFVQGGFVGVNVFL